MPPAKNRSTKGNWTDIIRSITTPMGFFVLVILVGESALTVVLTYAKLSEDHVWEGFILMLWVFIFIVAIVALLTWYKPKNLLYGKEEYLNPSLEPSALKDQIEDLIVTKVKAECLKPPQT